MGLQSALRLAEQFLYNFKQNHNKSRAARFMIRTQIDDMHLKFHLFDRVIPDKDSVDD